MRVCYGRYRTKKYIADIAKKKKLIQQQNAKDASGISVSNVAFCVLAILQMLGKTLSFKRFKSIIMNVI